MLIWVPAEAKLVRLGVYTIVPCACFKGSNNGEAAGKGRGEGGES